jgi:putative endonuclease
VDDWFVYMIYCSDTTLYTGITKDINRRYAQHATQKGAKYFRSREPSALVYQERGHDRSSASKREIEIKKLSRKHKIQLVLSENNLLQMAAHKVFG